MGYVLSTKVRVLQPLMRSKCMGWSVPSSGDKKTETCELPVGLHV